MERLNAKSRLARQQGVFMPLLAVIGLGIFSFIFLVAAFTSRVKLAQSEVRGKLDLACGEVAKKVDYVSRKEAFIEQINTFLNDESLRYTTIVEARLIMPTMPQADDFDFPGGTVSNPVGAGQELTLSGCGTSHGLGEICKVAHAVPSEQAGYPSQIWKHTSSAGHMVACEIKAKAKVNFLSSYFLSLLEPEDSEFRLKSVWASPVRGPAPVYDSTTEISQIATSPGLTIAIGTELYTSVWDRRFRFSNEPEFGTLDPLLRAFGADSQDFFGVAPPAIRLAPQFYVSPPASILPPAPISRQWGGGSARNTSNSARFDDSDSYWNRDSAAAAGATMNPTDLDEYLTACMNPLVLVRNTFLSVIVEMAARHGQLRNMTEILHINPVHRDPGFFPPQSAEIITNPPTKIVEFGQDLTQSAFQLPYVFYHSGLSGAHHKNGWINPFRSPGNSNPINWLAQSSDNRAAEHALIAGQLRYCHSLYASQGLARPDPLDLSSRNVAFEPLIYQESWGQIRDRGISASGAAEEWDQECQYEGAGCNVDRQRQEGLTAGQLVSILGTTQSCPYHYPGCASTVDQEIGGYGEGGVSNELQPDLLATVRYLHADGENAVANDSPGLFPLINDSLSPRPFGNRSRLVDNQQSAILYVLHQAPSDPESIEEVQNILRASFGQQGSGRMIRPVTVIYMPSTFHDSNSVSNLQEAFSLLLDPTSVSDGNIYFENSSDEFIAPILIVNLSPYDEAWGPYCKGPGAAVGPDGSLDGKTQAEIFQDYWTCLLTNETSGIAQFASDIFAERLLNRKLKF